MKKPILIAILVSILILGGSYYYFYILNPVPEEPKLPTKQKIVIQKPVTSLQPKTVAKVETKTEKKKEDVKIAEQKKVEVKSKEEIKIKTETKVQKDKKEPEKIKKEAVQKPSKKPRFYSLVYIASNTDEANKIKDDVYNKGYHTVRVGKHGGKDAVIISPFTDKWEAEYVLKHLVQDTSIKNFRVVAIY